MLPVLAKTFNNPWNPTTSSSFEPLRGPLVQQLFISANSSTPSPVTRFSDLRNIRHVLLEVLFWSLSPLGPGDDFSRFLRGSSGFDANQ